MEVFMRNLPSDLTDRSLHRQLQPFMERLSITNYVAEKQRNKTIGHLTFLREADGRKFLQRHGEELLPQSQPTLLSRQQRHPPTRARLSIMQRNVFCRLSDREPQELTLRSLQHEAEQQDHGDAAAEAVKTLEATELTCGYYDFDQEGRLTFTALWTATERCLVKFTKRNLLLTLTGRDVQLRVSFQSIVELVWWQSELGGTAAVTLSWAPTILEAHTLIHQLAAGLSAFGVSQANSPGQLEQRRRLVAIDPDHAQIAPFCLVYHFRVPGALTRHVDSDFQGEIARLRRRELFPVTRYRLGFRKAYAASLAESAAALRVQIAQYNGSGSLPFDLLVLLQALVANGYLHPATVSALAGRLAQAFGAAKEGGGSTQPPVSVDAFKKLFEWIDYPSPYGDPNMFKVDGIMEYLEEAERHVRDAAGLRSRVLGESQHRARIFRAVVTPSRVTLHGPELEPMNRVLRKFSDHSYFIRAQFCDENGQDLFNANVGLGPVYDRFKSVLGDGVEVAGRRYKLLGFSHSSLRARSAWLSAPFVHRGQLQLPELIITGLGDFTQIKSPARRAARIGQAFSETPYAVDLDENEIRVLMIPDVERNGRVFSDGVGTISPGAAEAIYKVVPESSGLPTCFQIRWAGAKGMLSLDPRLEGNQICIRPSMVKFDSSIDRQLEICGMGAKPIPMVLNRQLIKILEDMGAPREWFLDLQSREVHRLRGITATVYNTASFVRAQKIGEGIRLHSFLRQTEAMGIDYRRDPFLRAAVEAVLLREIRLLKHRARIPVRKGMTLYGVMDVTGFLGEGEVYVTFDPEGGRQAEPPGPGPVIVSRSPALHPGDAQVARNKVPPAGHPLAQQRNCIAFSMWGARDLPSQLSGGDLDGDYFHVIWDPDVVPSVRTFGPADYARVPPLELDRPVTSADLAGFFVDFMEADHLGVIATRHMTLADQRKDGTLDPACLKLAELHSLAVDFSKSGQPVELRSLPPAARWRPDFLAPGPLVTIHDKSAIAMDTYVGTQNDADDEDGDEGPRHRYYKSDKVLGQLYRAVDEQKIWAEDIRTTVTAAGPSFWDQLLAAIKHRVSAIGPVEWRHRSDEAHMIRDTYEDAIYGVMVDCADHPHQPLRELEVFVGFIMNKTGVQTHRQRDRSVKLRDKFEDITAECTHAMRNPTSIGGHTSELDALELCLACLHVGCLKQDRGPAPGHRISTHDVESFKIVAASALLRELDALGAKGTGEPAYVYGGGYPGVGASPSRVMKGKVPGGAEESVVRR